MRSPYRFFLSTERKNKRIITIAYDIFAIALSLYLSIAVRLGTIYIPLGLDELASITLTVIVTLYCFTKLGMYRAVLRYMMIPALGNIFLAVLISSLVLALSGFFFKSFIPRSVPFIYTGIAILTLGGPRILIRTLFHYYYRRKKPNVLIYGAGETGRNLASSLLQGDEYHPVAILDDDQEKDGNIIYGLRVYHSSHFQRLSSLYSPKKLLLAINNISQGKRLRLLDELSHWPIEVQSVPSLQDIAAGKGSATEVKDLDIADLLGRAPIAPDPILMNQNIKNKVVMVTGAGGSIGSELCRQIIAQEPKTLVLFELNEYNLYKIDQELKATVIRLNIHCELVSCLGSVQNENRLVNIMSAQSVETIYHAAAYKHVPIVEDNIIEGIRNNVFGTRACAKAAIETGVNNFTLISTDKAVRPTNIMGASKRLAELVLQAFVEKDSNTTFTMVRFGNVLGSSGSVVPLFKKQIRKGGPVTVTHPDITRYFMLIPEAAQLVIQASSMAKNGQVFVLDMGEPVKILDLAKRMIHLMGMRVTEEGKDNGDIAITFSGLRPGEKLYEELLIGENVEGTSHKKIMTARESSLKYDELDRVIQELDKACHNFDIKYVEKLLKELPLNYCRNKIIK
ncbi:nucleoside-diphosphate sugar epimerase [Vibrio sp. UCD-FRSSP16_10]|uniref:nucleoside-diphosphate sugar epimerase/dehydratase n=1 Tax=unclassified Vibrio TaxID=2614977 RepID=UPI0007FCA066|nr:MULTISPECIES: nucleoside-diphosphate sugar epimerase/dehydratase [unclassified Vibrio]OBT13659.1 nucleoside-diphosphate sugar epimerase [Vibrio sp. UCD-FRSSP16_30]OBT19213.1 nucleoside-diphosphate sugar epimerase [Vibrio sp. UCD-FRSSP16_10]